MIYLQSYGQEAAKRQHHQLPDFPFVIVSDSSVTTPPVVSDSLFDAAARGIRFRVNSTDLQDDDPFIALYKQRLVPWLKEKGMQLRQVYVKGAASPEGSYQNNVRLSRERTRRLIELLSSELGQPVDASHPIEAKSITEDYDLLVKMMREAGDADYDRVSRLWRDCNGDDACCKQRLMALDGGRVWRRLLHSYFPALRQARVILWFACKPKPAVKPQTEQIMPPVQLPPTPTTAVVARVEQPVKYERRHLIAARTNLLHDFLYVPQFGWANGVNIQLEYYPKRGHLTYNAGFTFTNHRHWTEYKFFQIRDLQLELRRYFKGGGKFIGPYMSVYLEGIKFGIGFNREKGWEGEGGGGGLSAGWTFKLIRNGHLRMELSASFGMLYIRHDPYIYNHPFVGYDDGLYYYDYYGNARDFKERNHQWTWFGPTNAGIHITYDIVYRKKKPAGYYNQKGGKK